MCVQKKILCIILIANNYLRSGKQITNDYNKLLFSPDIFIVYIYSVMCILTHIFYLLSFIYYIDTYVS